nr:MAG TPA: hypothetical protein [Microviridae sp.]
MVLRVSFDALSFLWKRRGRSPRGKDSIYNA